MESGNGVQSFSKQDDEKSRYAKRAALKELNTNPVPKESSKLDSSLRRHTALIKRIRQSVASDNRDQILKDIDSLSLEKYVDEIAGAIVEGTSRCKTEKDVWSAVEVISAIYRRFPSSFGAALVPFLTSALSSPSRTSFSNLPPEQREKEDSSRVTRQRPALRVCSELALVGVIKDAPSRSGGEWIMKVLKELLSNDPSLSSLPLLITFLKSYSLPFLGITPAIIKQVSANSEPGMLSATQALDSIAFPSLVDDNGSLIEQDIRDRFKRMCEGYFESVSKKLVIEHKRLQEQDRRNHEAYIRSGEIFEDRQQAYERMTKGYEKLLASCQSLSELLYLPMPSLPTASQKSDSILIGTNSTSSFSNDEGDVTAGGKWEDEEERRFFEDVQDLKDFVPKSILGVGEGESKDQESEESKEKQNERHEQDREYIKKATTPPLSSQAPQGPSQLLTALLIRLPDATNRELIDQAAIDFAFLNSKAARKRLVKFLSQVSKSRIDLLPHYSRLVATLDYYMPDIGSDLISILDEEFRYLQRKKNVVKEFSEVRLKNIVFISNLTKFGVVPTHLVLHMFKVCLDDFSGTNVDNIALLLEGCGRYLLQGEETRERFGTMLELMRRKQSLQHFDQRQLLLLENAYYQCNPPERAPRQEKVRPPMELFIRHLIYDVLAKRTIDKVLKLIRKLDWEDEDVRRILFKVFTKPWKIKYGNISLLAMLTYDLQRYHPDFPISVVDQILEDIRRGLEQNMYSTNQRRIATIKYLGELYIYRLLSSSIMFDILWLLITFGHPDGRALPNQFCPLDMPDDFFRVRLVCVLLDTCGMCFDRGTQRKKLDNFLTMFQFYIHCKQKLPMDVDFMLSDSLDAIRPKFELAKTIEEAAVAVDNMLGSFQATDLDDEIEADEGGDDSSDEDERVDEDEREEDDEGDVGAQDPLEVVLSGSASLQENLGPSEEADAEFARELAKMVMDSSSESRKVDKKTALALWDSSVLPAVRKRREDPDEALDIDDPDMMKFTVLTKRGNRQLTRQLAVPSESALAVHTRSAQLQDKVEQQHLKRLVLDYEQREEAEELKALGIQNRMGAIKIRYAG
ncbi:ARM repeat-containing protein [Guyanagaster necrorhizus]|uniref:ARM repeat-containing protein n=1 Tax=Guyanagaster necrorhizus TaxID=856835 RepID=A0A9P8AMN4_9AGAR|nr:ARM repeat-containing protein [Guyanagaster necrorhizus MCA 3950]KAG7440017.1 ARM repeat-containing protein [Guyanagaster necrorhizus MCA 3950]